MVGTQNLDWLRRNNFGLRIQNRPVSVDGLAAEIQRYDAQDAMEVARQVRATAGLGSMVDRILEIYAKTLKSWQAETQPDPAAESRAFSIYLRGISDKVYQGVDASHVMQERVGNLERELETMRGSLTWRIYERVTRNPVVHKLYHWLAAPFRQRGARRKK
jgi:hypothetical protein